MSTALDRVPFEFAISEPTLLRTPWLKLSVPQQTALKILYGLPLTTEQELILWSAFQGYGVFDDLGYLLSVTEMRPYVATEYNTITCIFGRRSGKSDRIAGFATAYEITLGGHTTRVNIGQDLYWLYVAQDLGTAQTNMKFVLSTLAESPVLSKEVINPNKPGIEEIKFKNGIILRGEPPNIKTARGVPVCGVTMDEIGFWYKDAKSANPDFEVERAVAQAMLQFQPFAKQLRFSTPWTKEGLLYAANQAGTEGSKFRCLDCQAGDVCPHVEEEKDKFAGHVVLQAPTAMMGNPFVTREALKQIRRRDLEAFARESLAQFTDTQTSFLTHSSVERAVDLTQNGKMRTTGYIDGANYVAAIDPAFRKDGFTLTVVHNDDELGVVQDYIDEWQPEPGQRLNPKVILAEIKAVLDLYQLNMVYSDQAQLESLQQLALDLDFAIFGIDFTVKTKTPIMSTLATLLNMDRLKLLHQPKQTLQLKQLQKTLGPNNYIAIAAPPGKHDDFATVLALACHQALRLPGIEKEDKARSYYNNPEIAHREASLEALRQEWARNADTDPSIMASREMVELYEALAAND